MFGNSFSLIRPRAKLGRKNNGRCLPYGACLSVCACLSVSNEAANASPSPRNNVVDALRVSKMLLAAMERDDERVLILVRRLFEVS